MVELALVTRNDKSIGDDEPMARFCRSDEPEALSPGCQYPLSKIDMPITDHYGDPG